VFNSLLDKLRSDRLTCRLNPTGQRQRRLDQLGMLAGQIAPWFSQ